MQLEIVSKAFDILLKWCEQIGHVHISANSQASDLRCHSAASPVHSCIVLHQKRASGKLRLSAHTYKLSARVH